MPADVPDLPKEITIHCACGRHLQLELYGGQYPSTYTGLHRTVLLWLAVEVD